MDEQFIKDFLQEHPEFKNLAAQTLIISPEKKQEYDLDAKLLLIEDNPLGKEVSYKLLHDLFAMPRYFSYVKKLYAGELSFLRIDAYENGDTKCLNILKRKEIISSINYLLTNNLIRFTESELSSYESIKSSMSYETFLENNSKKTYSFQANKKEYALPVISFLNFLTLPADEYCKIVEDSSISTIFGFDKRIFAYACTSYFNKDLLDEYFFPKTFLSRLDALRKYEYIDYESLEKLGESKNDITSKVNINSALKEAVLESLPEHFSALEKALYIYFKLCEILTYDEEYYAAKEDKRVKYKHESIKNVVNISPLKNSAVCYEINAIFAKFLKDLGLNVHIKRGEQVFYGDGHENLEFSCDEYYVRADTVTSIFKGDLSNVKMGKEYEGLKCLNKNANTFNRFHNIAKKVYDYILNMPKNKQRESFIAVTSYYQMVQNKDTPVPSFEERFEMFLSKITSLTLIGIDRLSYILDIYNRIFSLAERRNNFKVTIVGNNKPLIPNKVATPEVILSFNEQAFFLAPELTKHFILTKENTLIPIAKEELEEKFQVKDYVKINDPAIPDINTRR